ncbi:hypothetical protein Goklo_016646, partial [Gossypium klotzschianum]|nr:hypothetical protein [Gossypium klotzschianum]
ATWIWRNKLVRKGVQKSSSSIASSSRRIGGSKLEVTCPERETVIRDSKEVVLGSKTSLHDNIPTAFAAEEVQKEKEERLEIGAYISDNRS